jgi:phosphoribosyl 1,2-cyclic phosphodiesterase
MHLASLGSGSKGNCTVVRSGNTNIVIDCGFSLRQFEQRLQVLSLSAADIDAILVTHEHSDHGSGVNRVAQKYQIPIYLTIGSARNLDIPEFQPISGGQQFELGDIYIQVVTVPHDAAEPVQFIFTDKENGCRFGMLTDSGHVTSHMIESYRDLNGLLLEFNYDQHMLENGPYPFSLKQRVASSHGHLSNTQSIQMLQQINSDQLECLIAAHISEKNNSPELVSELLQPLSFGRAPILATQQDGFEWMQI